MVTQTHAPTLLKLHQHGVTQWQQAIKSYVIKNENI